MAAILIIEDNAANMKLAVLLLRNAGHTPLCATDAESGLTATALLKQDPATASIPAIALTAMAMSTDRAKALEAGCSAYIAKPLRYQDLYSAINSLVGQHKARAAD